MKKAKRSSGSVLDELDTRPLTDHEIVAMGYEPTPDGWRPFRKELLPTRIEPEQSSILENYKKVTEITDAPSKRRARTGRPSRKGR